MEDTTRDAIEVVTDRLYLILIDCDDTSMLGSYVETERPDPKPCMHSRVREQPSLNFTSPVDTVQLKGFCPPSVIIPANSFAAATSSACRRRANQVCQRPTIARYLCSTKKTIVPACHNVWMWSPCHPIRTNIARLPLGNPRLCHVGAEPVQYHACH